MNTSCQQQNTRKSGILLRGQEINKFGMQYFVGSLLGKPALRVAANRVCLESSPEKSDKNAVQKMEDL